jgi:hypothetical protein
MELFFHHAALNPGRPVCIGLQIGGRTRVAKEALINNLEERGLAALYFEDTNYGISMGSIPDSFGKTDEELAAMPPFVRDFVCNKGIEKGDPYCGSRKFTTDICPTRKFQTSWHPGWRWHALVGNIYALSMIEALHEALDDIKDSVYGHQELFDKLKAKEDEFYTQFIQSGVHEEYVKQVAYEGGLIDPKIFFSRGVCRTGRLPAESRFLGIQTESDKVGFLDYDKGIGWKEAIPFGTNRTSGLEMPLVYVEQDRQVCEVPTTYGTLFAWTKWT